MLRWLLRIVAAVVVLVGASVAWVLLTSPVAEAPVNASISRENQHRANIEATLDALAAHRGR
jgi:hypothetical protein